LNVRTIWSDVVRHSRFLELKRTSGS